MYTDALLCSRYLKKGTVIAATTKTRPYSQLNVPFPLALTTFSACGEYPATDEMLITRPGSSAVESLVSHGDSLFLDRLDDVVRVYAISETYPTVTAHQIGDV